MRHKSWMSPTLLICLQPKQFALEQPILVGICDLLELFESMFLEFFSYFEKVDHSPVHNKGPVYL